MLKFKCRLLPSPSRSQPPRILFRLPTTALSRNIKVEYFLRQCSNSYLAQTADLSTLAATAAYGGYQFVMVPNPAGGYTQVPLSCGGQSMAALNQNPCAPQREGNKSPPFSQFLINVFRPGRVQSVHLPPAARIHRR